MKETFETICLLGTVQALFLFIALIIKKENRKANRFLSLIMAFTALDMLELYAGVKGYLSLAGPYQLSIIPYSYIFGPSTFLYIILITAKIDRFSKKFFLLYGPFVVTFTINTIIFCLFNTELNSNNKLPEVIPYINAIINGGGLIYESVLYILSFYFLHRYTRRLKEYFSDIDKLKLTLLKVALAIIILVVLFIFIPFTKEGHIRHDYELLDVIAILGGLGLLFGMAFFAIIQPEIFNRVRLIAKAIPEVESSGSPKYEKLRLSKAKEEEYVKKLKELMTREKPYLEEELTLQDLADELSLSTHHLSMILNIHLEQSFYNFINRYRIEEVKSKLGNPDFKDASILTIAFSAGFNSKSTFNTMFKKFTGKTPKEYRTDSLNQ